MESIIILPVILFLMKFNHAAQLVYEFGNDEGETVYKKDGAISLLKYETIINLPISNQVQITYLKVTVDSLSPPKVDYEALLRQVSIKYTWIQITASSYSIEVKGLFAQKKHKS